MPWSSQRASVGSLAGDKGKGGGGGGDDHEVAPDPHFRSREAGRFSGEAWYQPVLAEGRCFFLS